MVSSYSSEQNSGKLARFNTGVKQYTEVYQKCQFLKNCYWFGANKYNFLLCLLRCLGP